MKPTTLLVLVILIVAAVAVYIVLSPKPAVKPSPTSPAPTAITTAPVETTAKTLVKTAVEQSASDRIDAARLEFKGNWFTGSRCRIAQTGRRPLRPVEGISDHHLGKRT